MKNESRGELIVQTCPPSFIAQLLRSMWTYFVVISTILGLILIPKQSYWVAPSAVALVACLAALRTVKAAGKDYKDRIQQVVVVHQDEIAQLLAEIKRRDDEIAKLSVRPYDDAQIKLVRAKIGQFNTTGRDLLRYLLHRGESVDELIYMDSKVGQPGTSRLLDQMRLGGLLVVRESPRVPANNYLSPTVQHWRVAPAFESVLRHLLYPRKENNDPMFEA